MRAEVAGVAVDNLNEDETLAAIDRMIQAPGPHFMAVVNAAKIAEAARDPELKKVLASADLVTADGMSVVWASRLLGRPLKARVTGIDMLGRLVAHAARRGLSVYFLGAKEESVRGTVERHRVQYPGLKIAGYRNGYFDRGEAHAVAEEVKRTAADLLFVGMGSPAQEKWISSNLASTGARFALGVGGSFDHISGLARRAPIWMQQAGLEWLYRFLHEPRRLWRRYLVGNTIFIWLILKQILSRRES
jgi:N-acetylglucosaminyldiphosphoundecaprenol N-acetyl-beta-D-mannosaminyltransferase